MCVCTSLLHRPPEDIHLCRPADLCELCWDCQEHTLFFSSFCLCRSSRAARRCSALSRCSSSRRRRSWSCFSRSALAFSSFSSHTAFLAAGVGMMGHDLGGSAAGLSLKQLPAAVYHPSSGPSLSCLPLRDLHSQKSPLYLGLSEDRSRETYCPHWPHIS